MNIHNFTVNILPAGDFYFLRAESDLVGQTAPVILNSELVEDLAYSPVEYDLGSIKEMVTLGKDIYYKLFPETLRTQFERARAIAREQAAILRLLLKFGESKLLHQVPWELMHDGHRSIALDPVTPIVRYIEQPNPVKSMRVKPPVRVLFTTACPKSRKPLDLTMEEKLLRSALKPFEQSVQLDVRRNVSLRQLRHAFIRAQQRELPFHIWHHCGHGTNHPVSTLFSLVLEEQGQIEPAFTKDITNIIEECPTLRLAIFNVCLAGTTAVDASGLAPGLAAINVPATIGFRHVIDDPVALDFIRALYGALLDQPVDMALKIATRALFDPIRPLDWTLPLLFLRTTEASLLT